MSEPTSKIDKPDAISRQLHQSKNEENYVEFFVVLCHDLFFEVLQFGNRLQLTKLENTGRRFFRYIERYFETTPFLRLNLDLWPRSGDSEQQLEAAIVLWKKEYRRISLSDFIALPSFLRFDIVELNIAEACCLYDTQPIADKCLLFENLLQSVKPALTGSILSFRGDITENKPSCFHDHFELLNYVSDRILPICNESREYGFSLFGSDAGQYVIASILQTPQLIHCSSAQFLVYYASMQLPVKEITNWLNRKCDSARKKSLYIYSDEIENLHEMIDHLKEGFKQDKLPVPPYTFSLCDDYVHEANNVNEKTLINEKTNEEFSVRKTENEEKDTVIIIERAATKKKR